MHEEPAFSETLEGNVSILYTAYVPSGEETNAIQARCAIRRKEMEQIRGEVEKLQARLLYLDKMCRVGEALVAPIRKVPPEIMAEIFVHCIPEITPRDSEAGGGIEPMKHLPHHVRQCLDNVCRTWRAVLQETSRAWSTLTLDFPISDPGIVEDWLCKSKNMPLEIFIRPVWWYWNEAVAEAVFALLCQEMRRFRVFVADFKHFRGVSTLFPPGSFADIPLMETFSIVQTGISLSDTLLGVIHAPRLRSLTLRRSEHFFESLTETSLQNLRHLDVDISRGPSTSFLPYLALCRSLESLQWTDFSPQSEDPPDTITSVVFPYLKSLQVSAEESEHSTAFLGCIHAPALESLTLRASLLKERGPVLDMLGSLFGEDIISLRRLHIRNASLTGPSVKQILTRLSNLDTLLIGDRCDADATLFATISPGDRKLASACPRLRTLQLNNARFPSGSLADLLHLRNSPYIEGPVPGYITCLNVLNCDPDGKDDEVVQYQR